MKLKPLLSIFGVSCALLTQALNIDSITGTTATPPTATPPGNTNAEINNTNNINNRNNGNNNNINSNNPTASETVSNSASLPKKIALPTVATVQNLTPDAIAVNVNNTIPSNVAVERPLEPAITQAPVPNAPAKLLTKYDNYIVIAGRTFATIDNSKPEAEASLFTCDSGSSWILPAGWAIAKHTHAARIAVMLYPWGTNFIVMDDGMSYPTNTRVETPHSSKALTESQDANGNKIYKATNCLGRIMIVKEGGAPEEDEVTYREREIKNFVTFNGTSYATLDDTLPDLAEQGCQDGLYEIPTGWKLAEHTVQSQIVLLGSNHSFGTTCFIYSNGKSYYPDGSDCGLQMLLEFEIEATRIYKFYWPAGCNRRILIQREDKDSGYKGSSWNVSPIITETAVVEGTVFATMNNAPPKGYKQGVTGHSCQNQALLLPPGWELADPNSNLTETVLSENTFGYWCLVMKDGQTLNTGPIEGKRPSCGEKQLLTQSITEIRMQSHVIPVYDEINTTQIVSYETVNKKVETTSTYHAVKYCDKAVLMQRPAGQHNLTMFNMTALYLTSNETTVSFKFGLDILDSRNLPRKIINTQVNSTFDLVDAFGYPLFYVIYLADSTLSYQKENGDWQSSLSSDMWVKIRNFAAQSNVKIISLFTYPSSSLGLKMEVEGQTKSIWLHSSPGSPVETNAIFLPEGEVWYTQSSIIPDRNDVQVTPLLQVNEHQQLVTGFSATPKNIVAAIVRRSTGVQELHLMLATSSLSPHSRMVSNFALDWGTQNVEIQNYIAEDEGVDVILVVSIIGGILGGIFLLVLIFVLRHRIKGATKTVAYGIETFNKDDEEAKNAYG